MKRKSDGFSIPTMLQNYLQWNGLWRYLENELNYKLVQSRICGTLFVLRIEEFGIKKYKIVRIRIFRISGFTRY